MHAIAAPPPRWTTAVAADASDTAPAELRELGAHVSRCNGSRDRWFSVRCTADAVHDFVAPRFVTTLCIASALIGLAAIML
ncbi:MAG TPA: hypothetical protein VNU71_00175 [Burkholderiaceae bacterium]|nr:hypothetical protein [Burkholderiaceae bacterium]